MSPRSGQADAGRHDLDAEPSRPARPILELGALGVATVAAATAWRQTYGTAALVAPLLTAAIVPTAVAVLLNRRRAIVALVANVVLFVVSTVGLLALAGASAPVTSLLDGLQRGWGDTLSTAVPVAGDPSLLVVPIVLTWLAALVGSELVVRTRRVLAPLVAPLALLVAARAYAPSGADNAMWATVGLLVAGIVLVAARHARVGSAPSLGAPGATHDDEDARRLARRRTIVALPLAILATLIGVVVGPRVVPASSRPAASLRDARAPQTRAPSARDPLDELNGTLAVDPGTRLFTVSTPARAVQADVAPTGPASRWVLVTLDVFDGTSWRSSARYTRAGTTLPSGPPVTVATVESRQTFEVAQLPATWLPTAGRPTEARATDGRAALAFDATSGTLATDADAVPSGLRYEVTSTIAMPTGAELAAARLPATAAFAPYAALPVGIPREITEATRTAMGSAHNPFEQVAALERYLQGNGFVFDPQALTGHSTGDLARFLSDKPNARHGTAEQFATAFAVMARTRGLPTRLAVGFRPRPGSAWRVDGDQASLDITRGDTDVWPEVYFDGLGWIAFDPVPSNGSTSARPQLEPEEVVATKSRAADAAASAQPAPAAASNPILQADAGTADDGSRPWLIVVVVLGAAAVIVLLALRIGRVLSRRRRRARRRGGDAGARILGAWHEVVDHLDRVGVGETAAEGRTARADHLSSATVTEIVDATATRFGDDAAAPVRALGLLVNTATFEPEPPTAADADRAWQLESDVHRRISRRSPVLPHGASTVSPAASTGEPSPVAARR
jgi:transglutaminase-like putative cysteine protease